MAKKSSDKERQPWEVDFLYVELDGAQKKEVQTFDPAGAKSFECLEGHVLGGAKLSIVHDMRNDCTIASITSPKPEKGGRQVCISARGPDMGAAIRVLAYKLIRILDNDLGIAREVSEQRSQWG